MKYETAKTLKDSGFPQETQWVYVDVGREWPPSLILRQPAYGGGIPTAAPTLEELIEACGVDVGVFVFADKTQGANAWYKHPDPDEYPSFHGSTPPEAVANLWLALNKN